MHQTTPNSHDVCVICGKVSPYTQDTHIDYRIGYIEGAGQGCFWPAGKCESEREHRSKKIEKILNLIK